ncbi:MAG: RsmD family RNA methyltransferase [Leptospirales bacterium]|nr:RsmD family RNA methyltransferase [Leptospirales bacterium]
MKNSIRIAGGKYKGRALPWTFQDIGITAQKVKEALFSILGNIEKKSFADLFGGSGQIAFEALSRGASPVICIELDRERAGFISSFGVKNFQDSSFMPLNMSFLQAMRFLSKKGIRPDYIFADPPYEKGRRGDALYLEIAAAIVKHGLAFDGSVLIIQHFSKTILPERIEAFHRIKEKKYGSTTLSFYEYGSSSSSV